MHEINGRTAAFPGRTGICRAGTAALFYFPGQDATPAFLLNYGAGAGSDLPTVFYRFTLKLWMLCFKTEISIS